MSQVSGNLYLRARRFARLWKREKKIEEERRKIASGLIPSMRRSGLEFVRVAPRELLFLASTRRKRVAKKDLMSFFGRKGELFWENVPDDISEYLTVIKVAGDRP